MLELLAALRGLAERNLAEVERLVRGYFHDRDDLEPVSRKELRRRLREGGVTVLDVRPEDEFALGHLPGALNIPLRALKARLSELNPSQEIVAYCRGPHCMLSYEACRSAGAWLQGSEVGRRPSGMAGRWTAGLHWQRVTNDHKTVTGLSTQTI